MKTARLGQHLKTSPTLNYPWRQRCRIGQPFHVSGACGKQTRILVRHPLAVCPYKMIWTLSQKYKTATANGICQTLLGQTTYKRAPGPGHRQEIQVMKPSLSCWQLTYYNCFPSTDQKRKGFSPQTLRSLSVALWTVYPLSRGFWGEEQTLFTISFFVY